MQNFVKIKTRGGDERPREIKPDYEKFRRVHKSVNVVTSFLGGLLGLTSVITGLISPYPNLVSVFLLIPSLLLGEVHIRVVRTLYLRSFPDGVPIEGRPEVISPNETEKVVKRHLWKFLKWLAISFASAHIVLVIYKIAT